MRTIVMLVLIVAAVIWIGTRMPSAVSPQQAPVAETPQEEADRPPTRKEIIYAARTAITRGLKAPDSVEFPVAEDPSYQVADIGDQRYQVRGTLKAQNAFGVTLQNPWAAEVQFLPGDEIKPLMLMLDGDVLYDARPTAAAAPAP